MAARDPRQARETPAVKRGEHHAPSCDHGEWTFAGADYKRRATKWRCPTGECQPASRGVKADRLHPLIAREFGGHGRSTGAVEPSSASAGDSSINGRCCPCASAGLSGSGYTPT